jgi:Prolyl oligopeptidase, N-terminal beta-propeller domain
LPDLSRTGAVDVTHDDSCSIVNSRGKCHDGNSGGGQSGNHDGGQVPDPYRDLEDSSDPAAAGWAAAQNELTEDTELTPRVTVSADGRYLVLSLTRGINPAAELRVLDLGHRGAGFRVLLPAGRAMAAVAASEGGTFYVLTDHEAGRRRIVAIDLASPGRPHWREVVPEAAETLLEAHFFGGHLVCHTCGTPARCCGCSGSTARSCATSRCRAWQHSAAARPTMMRSRAARR